MEIDHHSLIGRKCTRVYEHYPENFSFEFESLCLRVDCLWRIISDGQIARTSQDHGHQFGLPAPVDAFVEAQALLARNRVESVHWREGTNDLTLRFEGGVTLEVIPNSAGYEPWDITT